MKGKIRLFQFYNYLSSQGQWGKNGFLINNILNLKVKLNNHILLLIIFQIISIYELTFQQILHPR